MGDRICSIPGCGKSSWARGLCGPHYTRAYRIGNLPPLEIKPDWVKDVTDGCWVWQWRLSDTGYGTKSVRGKTVLAHRWVYEQYRGRIPVGLQLDHLCRNRSCVNPAHLEPVTAAENKLRGESLNAQNARKTHCLRGHPFDSANTYTRPDNGKRQCRECGRLRDRKRVRRRAIATLSRAA